MLDPLFKNKVREPQLQRLILEETETSATGAATSSSEEEQL